MNILSFSKKLKIRLIPILVPLVLFMTTSSVTGQTVDKGRALYFQAYAENNLTKKLALYTQIKNEYSEATMQQYRFAMLAYYDLLLEEEINEAAAVAQYIYSSKKGNNAEWFTLYTSANDLIQVNKYVKANELEKAEQLISKIELPKELTYSRKLLVQKAELQNKVGKTREAYESLILQIAKTPDTTAKKVLDKLGSELNKTPEQVQNEIWKLLEPLAKPAADFELKTYLDQREVKLSELKGNVVLLTYWFPTCGICIREFPHFENVLKKIDHKDVIYLGLNISSRQSDQVVPFLKANPYTFIALDDTSPREKGNLDNRNLAPMNFLIDKEGQIVFSNFRIDATNEDELEQMIRILLDR